MINLLPHNLREERIYGRRNRVMVGFIFAFVIAAALVVAVMLFSLQLLGTDNDTITGSIETNNSQIQILESETSQVGAVSSRLTTTHNLFDSSIKFSELIPNIGSLLPAGSTINGLTLTGGNTDPLSLDVNLATADLAPVLVQNLISSDLFEAADVNTITSIGDAEGAPSRYGFSASINVSFSGSAEAKRKKAAQAAAAAKAAEEINAEE